jgi:hypothetical protein
VRLAVTLALVEILVGVSQSGAVRAQEVNLDSTSDSTEVVVEPADWLGGTSSPLYGVNHRYGHRGYRM